MSISVDCNKCNGCSLCVRACPTGAIEVKDKLATIVEESCTMCGACVSTCRFSAISIDIDKQPVEDLDKYKDVWIFGEQRNGHVAPVVFELINIGRDLANKRNSRLAVVILGHEIDEAVKQIAQYPVDVVYVYQAPELKEYDAEKYCRVLTDVTRDLKPEIFLAGATTTGRSFMSGVAVNLYTGLTADCTGLEIGEDGLLHQTRPAYGGNIMATILCPYTRPQMATVRHKVFPVSCIRAEGSAEIVNITPKPVLFSSRSKVIDFIEEIGEKVNLVDADIIISGGKRTRRSGKLLYFTRACR